MLKNTNYKQFTRYKFRISNFKNLLNSKDSFYFCLQYGLFILTNFFLIKHRNYKAIHFLTLSLHRRKT